MVDLYINEASIALALLGKNDKNKFFYIVNFWTHKNSFPLYVVL